MAIATRPSPARTGTAPVGNAQYFRDLLTAKPQWLNEPNKDILAQWNLDNPGKRITPSIRTTLAKVKATMKGGGRRRARRATGETRLMTTATTSRAGITLIIPNRPESFPINIPGVSVTETMMKGEKVLKLELSKVPGPNG
jgi:hypothetical protein